LEGKKKKDLQENRLKATLQTLRRDDANKKKNTKLEQQAHFRNQSFLDDVKATIFSHPDILSSLDPGIL